MNAAPKRMRRGRAHAPPAIEEVAAVTERLAVLLSAGVTPTSAWSYLGEDSSNPVVHAVAVVAAAGGDVAEALASAVSAGGGRSAAHSAKQSGSPRRASPAMRAGSRERTSAGVRVGAPRPGGSTARASEQAELAEAWSGLAAAWFVAAESGAPLAQSLRRLAASFRSLGQTQRDLAVALAGPAATARMVMALPVVGVLFGMGLGFNTLQTLFATVPGLLCVTLGALLMWVGGLWNRRMLRAATPSDRTPGLTIDLMAVAMSGGGSLGRARAIVQEARERFLAIGGDDEPQIEGVLSLATRAGVPAVELLRSEAETRRRNARSAGQQAAAALAVRLMMPLGVCVLPAFMIVGVAPLLLAIVSSTVSSI